MNIEVFKSWAKVFLSSALTALFIILTDTGAIPMDIEVWQGILVAGLLSVIPVVINWLDPNDTRYGRGSE
jgi:hypothetical protein